MAKILFLAIPATILLSACNELPLTEERSVAVNYRCDSGATFSVRFGAESATLTLDQDTYTLHGERAASGAKYSNRELTFWGKGDNSILMINDETWQCQSSD
ncbi:MliC family protein [Pseudoalteromonas sp. T1lg75]|uniref:MliC family protein n=1 Tax=Pseudoalteromonas sp. T1lg75 TaxID=2077102 RepID=UPI000CF730FC|nr:MliC family protein [Pseudoalteromonas sp. T1lg75]